MTPPQVTYNGGLFSVLTCPVSRLQARSVALACTQLLEQVLLSSCSCFSILAAAWAAPAPRLAAAARRTAAKRFEQATASNARGFKALSAQQLLCVLQSEDLEVQLSQCVLQCAVCQDKQDYVQLPPPHDLPIISNHVSMGSLLPA